MIIDDYAYKNKLSKLNEEFKVIEQVVTECENN